MALIETLAIQLASNSILIFFLVLLATALWGDVSLIFFVAFSVNYGINLWIIFIAAYIGTQIGDSLWYAFGKFFEPYIEKSKRMKKGYVKVARMIEIIFGKRHLLALTAVKYLYGTRVITIIYLVKERIGYKKFVVYDFISTFFWVIGVGLVGYLVGIGFMAVKTFKNMQLAVTLLVIFIALYFLLEEELKRWIQRKVDRRLTQRKEKIKKKKKIRIKID
jgi:membrane protein DedA with SNARE-associated domain